MKSPRSTVRAIRRHLAEARTRRARVRARRGSTIIVVVSLLALLSILGVTINLFTQQAAVQARYMSEGSKEYEAPELDPRVMMDFALEQLILGPSEETDGSGNFLYAQSALWGGRHSMLPNMFGRDIHPFSGRGINVIDANGDGIPEIDQNFDGVDDGANWMFGINNSFAANGGAADPNLANFPDPDPEYTRPDLNTSFLGFSGYGLDDNGRPVYVVKPSFHPAQYLRAGGAWEPTRDWDTNPATVKRVLRPHAQHEVADGSGLPRFLTGGLNPFPFRQPVGTTPRSEGVWNLKPNWAPSRTQQVGDWIHPTSGNPNDLYFRATTPGATGTSAPNWATATAGNDLTPADGAVTWHAHKYPFYEYDADPNKDGIKESVYLDLGFPVQDFNGELFVPLFSFHIEDGDSRANLNATGNAQGFANVAGGGPFGTKPGVGFASLHESNHGLTPYEINLARTLTANPANSSNPAFKHLQDVFPTKGVGPATDYRELANIELFTLLKGLPHIDTNGNVVKANVGRYGEFNRTVNGFLGATKSSTLFPMPGISNVDDDGNLNFGESVITTSRNPSTFYPAGTWARFAVEFPNGSGFTEPVTAMATQGGTTSNNNPTAVNSISPGHRFADGGVTWMVFATPFGTLNDVAFGHPYDIRGTGIQHVPPTNPTQPDFQLVLFPDPTLPANPNRWMRYVNVGTQGWNKWSFGFGRNLVAFQPWMEAPNPDRRADQFRDEPSETFTANGAGDTPFTAADSAFLMHSPTVQATKGTSSRLAALAEINLVQDPNAAERRKRLTTISWDLRNRNVGPAPNHRPWEWNGNNFPPNFAGATAAEQPFRQALREWLRVQRGSFGTNGQTIQNSITQRLLSANHRVDISGGVPFLRRLTPHPARPGRAVITTGTQEGNAREDRQLMARDIYVLLYTFCGGWDAKDPTTDPNTEVMTAPPGTREIYDDSQTTAMAQFAVNLVDSLDGDDVITKFEFDRDLSDGWNLDDNAFTATDTITPNDRGIVFGVEAQSLTLSETLVVLSERSVEDPPSSGMYPNILRTRHDDSEYRDWTYVELRNASPHNVGFENEAWKIVVQPLDPTGPMETRHLVPLEGEVAGGDLFTIGTAGDAHMPDGSVPYWSAIEVDLDDTRDGDYETRIAPRMSLTSSRYTDLIRETHEGRFRMHQHQIASNKRVSVSDPAIGSVNPADNVAAIDNSMNKGDLLSFPDPTVAITNQPAVEFVLMRRLHPYRQAPVPDTANYPAESADNPWVEVDRTQTTPRVLASLMTGLNDADSKLALQNEIRKLFSTERTEPLVRSESPTSTGFAASADVKNTLGQINKLTQPNTLLPPNPFTMVQLHFDRDFTSPIDLFMVPLFGPNDTTHAVRGLRRAGTPIGSFPNLAGTARFLQPLSPDAFGPNGVSGDGDDPVTGRDPVGQLDATHTYKHDNRWYRLLGLVGTPSPMVNVTNATADRARYRLPGRVNWNTMSHPEVLAAMIDEDTAIRPWNMAYADGSSYPLTPSDPTKQRGYLASTHEDENDSSDANPRDWWIKFLDQRDGLDPVTSMRLPGTASGQPFRSPFFMTSRPHDTASPDFSLLRGLGDFGATADQFFSNGSASTFLSRRLFELGTATQRYGNTSTSLFTDQGDGHDIDLYSRHRVLSKMWANSTTRSNVFHVYVQIDFFEVVNTAGSFQIGGKKAGFPTHRAFYVIDRSLAYERLKGGTGAGGHFRPNGSASLFSIKGIRENGFDFRDVIVHGEQIE